MHETQLLWRTYVIHVPATKSSKQMNCTRNIQISIQHNSNQIYAKSAATIVLKILESSQFQ